MTRTIERYDEEGKAIYANKDGPLKDLWKIMAVINPIENREVVEANSVFDNNEFFKRLYLSRAELDVTSSVLQLLLKESASEISLQTAYKGKEKQFYYQNLENNENDSGRFIYDFKNSLVKEIANNLRSSANLVRADRICEHETVAEILLNLREKHRMVLIRISSQDQIKLNLNYAEAIPIILIDFSPYTLFKDFSSREQRNYKSPDQISYENLALVIQEASGKLKLLFQSRLQYIDRSFIVGFKNLSTGIFHEIYVCDGVFNKILEIEGINTEPWAKSLKLSRDRFICFLIMQQVLQESSEFPQDNLVHDQISLKITIDSFLEFYLMFKTDEKISDLKSESINLVLSKIYCSLMHEFLNTSGQSVNWKNIRQELLSTIDKCD